MSSFLGYNKSPHNIYKFDDEQIYKLYKMAQNDITKTHRKNFCVFGDYILSDDKYKRRDIVVKIVNEYYVSLLKNGIIDIV